MADSAHKHEVIPTEPGRSLNFRCRNCSAFSFLPYTRLPCVFEFLGDLYCNLLGRFYAQTCKRNES